MTFDIKRAFRESFLCSQLNPPELDQLIQIASVREINQGEILFLEGDVATGFYLLLAGQVRIYKSSPDGREITLHRIRAGQVFAEAAIFHGDKFPANCEVSENSVVAFFPKDKFIALLRESPQISIKMIGSQAAFLREFNQTIEMLSLQEVSERLATFLLRISERSPGRAITLDSTKGELAKRLGTINETLSRNLRKLIDLKIIQVEGKQITILDRDRLEAVADGDKI